MNLQTLSFVFLGVLIWTSMTDTKHNSKTNCRSTPGHVSLNETVLPDVVIRCLDILQWKSFVLIYDKHKESLYKEIILRLDTRETVVTPMLFDVTMVTQESIDTILADIHNSYDGHFHVILICHNVKALNILSAANTIDERSLRLYDYRHRSYWLVGTTHEHIENLKSVTLNLDNVALLTRTNLNCPSSSNVIHVAEGVLRNKAWKEMVSCQRHLPLKSDGTSVVYPNSHYAYNGREILATSRESGSCSTIVTKENRTEFTGYCFDIFKDLLAGLNMTYRTIESETDDWGHKREDGNWDGMVGELQRGEADVAVVDVTFHEDRVSVMDFVQPGLGVLNQVVLYRRNLDREPSFTSFLDPFQTPVYLVLLALLVCVPILYFSLERWFFQGSVVINIYDIYCYFVGSIFQHSGSLNPVSISARTVVATFWLGAMCLSVFYTAYLTASLTTGKDVQPFNNVKELIDNPDYKVGMKGRGPAYSGLKSATSGTMRGLWLKLVESNATDPATFESDIEKILDKVLTEKFAVILSKDLARSAMTTDCRFAYLKEVIVWQQISFAMRKNSPFKNDIERMLARVVENGLAMYSKDNSMNSTLTCETLRGERVDMTYMLGKQSVLLIGFSAALLALITENIVQRVRRRDKT